MKLIVGLGNPGKAYALNRHNVGFRCIDFLSETYSIPVKKRQCQARTGGGNIAGIPVLLAKPTTFVNNSGESVKRLMQKYSLGTSDLIVIYDDLDLPLGRIRIKQGGNPGGHKGVASIITALQDKGFCRIRIGIGRPVSEDGVPVTDEEVIVDYVLGNFTSEEELVIRPVIARAAEAVKCLLVEGLTRAMDRFNRAVPL